MKKDIWDISLEELSKFMIDMHQPRHRAEQIYKWLYVKKALNFKEMTDLPKSLREELNTRFKIGNLLLKNHMVSTDRTQKFLWNLGQDVYVETVVIPAKARRTVCLSTQVGCKFGCPFCASGANGFTRNLTSGEMIGQFILSEREVCGKLTNVVFMGMGEPLDNFDNLASAIRIINSNQGIAIGARKITVSTCGVIPGIKKIRDLGVQVELSVSFHASNNRLRNELVPVNRKYPIEKLVYALKDYFAHTGRVITLEYALIKGINDSLSDSDALADIARDLKAKVNLIPCNCGGKAKYQPAIPRDVEAFRKKLAERSVTVTLRKSKGSDISASCGQLAAGVKSGKQ